jgi:signal transduction histidine kinase
MNILDNAVGAIKQTGDVWIRIKTDEMYKKLIIDIEDNGEGMDQDVIDKVFDPFFTTKPVGQGTGLGMSITHKIVKNHQGEIDVQSVKGKGTKFTVTLPINLDRELLADKLVDKGADA